MDELLKWLNTIFSGGLFALALTVTWKASGFVQWVRDSFERNDECHDELKKSIRRVAQANGIEEEGR